MTLALNVDGELVTVAVNRVINAGYSGRDEAAVQAHIDELVEEGIPAPDEVPITFELAPYATLVDPGTITVVGKHTSGEAEYGLVMAGDDTFVVAASDQTDRHLEPDGIQLSKQIAPNVLSHRAWRLSDVRDHWDDIKLRAWNTANGDRYVYQETTLESLLPPESILDIVRDRYGGPLGGTIVLSGTVATVTGELSPGEHFEVELADPIMERSISLTYRIRTVTD